MRRALLATAALLLAPACSPEPPRVTPHSILVQSISPTTLSLALELDIENPNRFPLIVREVSGKVRVGSGVEVGTARSQLNGNVPARGTQRVPANVAVGWTNLGALLPLAAADKPVPYSFEGTAAIGGERLNVDVPFTVKGELTREQILSAGLRGFGKFFAPPAP